MKIQELFEMAKRATLNDFYAAAKKKYGAAAVQDIKWSDVVALARELDVTIPASAHNNKTGRGRVNLVPADHADAKVPSKEEPKTEPKKIDTPSIKKEVDLEHVSNQIYSAFKNHPMGSGIDGTNRPQKQSKGGYYFDFRDWGMWQVPDDEEDDGDYDHKEPTPETRKAFRELAANLAKQFGVLIQAGAGEKNWLEISVRKNEAI